MKKNKLHTWPPSKEGQLSPASRRLERECCYDRTTGHFYIFSRPFERVCTIATGRYGRVLLIRSIDGPPKCYATKVMSKALIVKKCQVQHVRQEIEILHGINHPFIVKMAAAFMDNCNCYIVMELVGGGDLFSILNVTACFSEDRASFYALQICLALEYLHGTNIAYRDLKPENVLIDMKGYLKLGDFGFARRCTEKMYTICGTVAYTAPEVLKNQGYDAAVDWWSLGILIYEMCHGFVPFDSQDAYKTQQMVLSAAVTYPPTFSPDLQDILRMLLQRNVSLRYKHGCDRIPGGITNHPWFDKWDLTQLKGRLLAVPWLPDKNIGKSRISEIDDIAQSNGNDYEESFREFCLT